MFRLRRVASAAVVVSVLAFASASPAVADSKNQSPRKHAVKCAQAAGKHDRLQSKVDHLSGRPTSPDPDVMAQRQAKLDKLQARIANAPAGC